MFAVGLFTVFHFFKLAKDFFHYVINDKLRNRFIIINKMKSKILDILSNMVFNFIIHPCDPTVVICYLIEPCDIAVQITYLVSRSWSLSYNTVV